MLAPPAVMFANSNRQMLVRVEEAVTVGRGFTVTMVVPVLEQVVPPTVLMPFTVYPVVETGLTTTLLPLPPLLQLYVVAPEAFRVVDSPIHIAVGLLTDMVAVNTST